MESLHLVATIHWHNFALRVFPSGISELCSYLVPHSEFALSLARDIIYISGLADITMAKKLSFSPMAKTSKIRWK